MTQVFYFVNNLQNPHGVRVLKIVVAPPGLLVYTLAQRQLRQALQASKSQLKNQLGKLTNRPTLRWIFQCFQSIHVLAIDGVKQISNLTDERLKILRFFPASCRLYYLLI